MIQTPGDGVTIDNINVAETMQRVAELIAAEKGLSPAIKDKTARPTKPIPLQRRPSASIAAVYPLGAAHAVALHVESEAGS
jgi:hypothetical protein